MAEKLPLADRVVGLSISATLDLAARGYSDRHLQDACVTFARQLLAAGARLTYGGDLRPGGFTESLLELVATYQSRDIERRPSFVNYLAYPVYAKYQRELLEGGFDAVEPYGRHIALDMAGNNLNERRLKPVEAIDFSPDDWAAALTAMRRRVTSECDCRIVLGGQVSGFMGRMPGVAEEALLALEAGQPLFVVGAFGGCAADILQSLELSHEPTQRRARWAGQEAFKRYGPENLHCGLALGEMRLLATTPHTGQAIALILRGMREVFSGSSLSGRRDNV